jgi:hypothetical protein
MRAAELRREVGIKCTVTVIREAAPWPMRAAEPRREVGIKCTVTVIRNSAQSIGVALRRVAQDIPVDGSRCV